MYHIIDITNWTFIIPSKSNEMLFAVENDIAWNGGKANSREKDEGTTVWKRDV